MRPEILPLGDQGLLLNWDNRLDPAVHQQVQAVWRCLQAAALPGVLDLVPAYSSLALLIESRFFLKKYPGQLPYEVLKTWVEALLAEPNPNIALDSGRVLRVPVCFEPIYALDLVELAAQKHLNVDELVERFCGQEYRVYLLGFLPGFAYLGTLDEVLATPRRAVPRTWIPAGSVGIAGAQTGIYPLDSPGGWQIIGRTPWQLFSPEQEPPVRLQVGDNVRFYPISDTEFSQMKNNDLTYTPN
jgi:inhibitor of KinA